MTTERDYPERLTGVEDYYGIAAMGAYELERKNMTWDSVQQFLRIVMQFAGGWLVAQGWMDGAGVEAMTGAVVSVGAFVWWMYWQNTKTA